jgi:hypothetical protein
MNLTTPKGRMLAAYCGQTLDRPPVAPEFWYYLPARLLGISMIELQREVPHWQALQTTFRHYGCEGWGIVAPALPQGLGGKSHSCDEWTPEGQLIRTTHLECMGRELRTREVYDRIEPSWTIERYIKDFEQDWPAYRAHALVSPDQLDWSPVQTALDAVGEDYLLEVYLGNAFIDFAGGQREGGLEQVLLDLADHPQEMRALQTEYIAYMRALTRAALTRTAARSLFLGSIWSSISLLSPRLWRTWDKPVVEAVIAEAHTLGGLVHHHFHGRCMGVLPDLAALGLDCICPFERPPGGDVVDLPAVVAALGNRTAFNGNVHTVETLIRGKPLDVEREVREILAAFEGPARSRLIVGTGDQVGWETPDDNIWAMIETVKRGGS